MMREEEYLDDIDGLDVRAPAPPLERVPSSAPASPSRFTSLRDLQAAPPASDTGGRVLRGIGRGLVAFGGGDVGAYDANTRANEEAPYRARKRSFEESEMHDTMETKQRSKALALARVDPASNESRQAQTDYVEELKSAAALPGIPEGFKKSLLDMAAGVSSMSAARIDAVRPNVTGRLNMMLKASGIQANHELATQNVGLKQQQIEATIGNQNTDNHLAAATLGETTRHHKAVEEAAANKPIKVKLPGEVTLKDHRMRTVALSEIDEILKLLPQVRYLGFMAEEIDAAAAKAPSALDPRNPAEIKVSGLLRRLRAPERNKIYGAALSKYDVKDSGAFMANLGNNRETVLSNLGILKDSLTEQNEMLAEQYPTMSGDPLPKHEKKTGAEGVDPVKAERTVKARAVVANPSKYTPKQVELAKKWLETISTN